MKKIHNTLLLILIILSTFAPTISTYAMQDINTACADAEVKVAVAGEPDENLTSLSDLTALLHYHNPNRIKQDSGKNTILHIAAAHGDKARVQTLLQQESLIQQQNTSSAVPLIAQKTNQGQTALILAAQHGDIEVVELLCKNDPHSLYVNEQDNEGKTALMLASLKNRADIVTLLLNHNADITKKDLDGLTALHAAAFVDDTIAIEALLQKEAAMPAPSTPLIATKDRHGRTPLMIAAANGNTGAAEILCTYDAQKKYFNEQNHEGATALALAVDHNDFDITSLLLKTAGNSIADTAANEKTTPLMFASNRNNPKTVSLLLDYNANITKQNLQNNTALHIAAYLGHTAIVQKLLYKDFLMQQQNAPSYSPLRTMKNIDGQTALSLAINNKHMEIIEMLRTAFVPCSTADCTTNSTLHCPCKTARYCSPQCQKKDWKLHHKTQCPLHKIKAATEYVNNPSHEPTPTVTNLEIKHEEAENTSARNKTLSPTTPSQSQSGSVNGQPKPTPPVMINPQGEMLRKTREQNSQKLVETIHKFQRGEIQFPELQRASEEFDLYGDDKTNYQTVVNTIFEQNTRTQTKRNHGKHSAKLVSQSQKTKPGKKNNRHKPPKKEKSQFSKQHTKALQASRAEKQQHGTQFAPSDPLPAEAPYILPLDLRQDCNSNSSESDSASATAPTRYSATHATDRGEAASPEKPQRFATIDLGLEPALLDMDHILQSSSGNKGWHLDPDNDLEKKLHRSPDLVNPLITVKRPKRNPFDNGCYLLKITRNDNAKQGSKPKISSFFPSAWRASDLKTLVEYALRTNTVFFYHDSKANRIFGFIEEYRSGKEVFGRIYFKGIIERQSHAQQDTPVITTIYPITHEQYLTEEDKAARINSPKHNLLMDSIQQHNEKQHDLQQALLASLQDPGLEQNMHPHFARAESNAAAAQHNTHAVPEHDNACTETTL